jgi:hypothetical protein
MGGESFAAGREIVDVGRPRIGDWDQSERGWGDSSPWEIAGTRKCGSRGAGQGRGARGKGPGEGLRDRSARRVMAIRAVHDSRAKIQGDSTPTSCLVGVDHRIVMGLPVEDSIERASSPSLLPPNKVPASPFRLRCRIGPSRRPRSGLGADAMAKVARGGPLLPSRAEAGVTEDIPFGHLPSFPLPLAMLFECAMPHNSACSSSSLVRPQRLVRSIHLTCDSILPSAHARSPALTRSTPKLCAPFISP